MIVTFDEDKFFAAGVCAADHHCKLSYVVAVFGEESPVTVGDSAQSFREVDHCRRRGSGAVAFFVLSASGGVDVRIVVTQNVRAVCAHIVDVAVAVDVPKFAAFGSFAEKRPFGDRNHAAFGRTEVAVDACRDIFNRACKFLLRFFVCIDRVFFHN